MNMNNFYRTSTRAGTIVFVLVLTGSIFVTIGKPIRKGLSKTDELNRELKDPLVALPSGSDEQQTGLDHSPAQDSNYQVEPIYSVIHESQQYKPNDGKPQYETIVEQQQAFYYPNRYQVTRDLGQSHEYAPSTVSSPDYPADNNVAIKNRDNPSEIIYVETNDETKTDGSQSTPDIPSTQLSGIGSLIYQDSNLPATILTEVPVKDMTQEVLEKLKRDYGVKVVATRERPGANLVINCDDYAGQENNICSKQHQIYPMSINRQRSYSYPERATESPTAVDNYQGNSQTAAADERPQIPYESSNYGQKTDESQSDVYGPGETRTSPSESTPPENVGGYDGYGIRNNAGTLPHRFDENQNSDTPATHESSDSAAQSEAAGQPEKNEAQSKNDPNGFDESSSGTNSSKNNQQYES